MIGLNAVPLSALSAESRELLAERLNPRKVLPIHNSDELTRHRDWRGVASLVPISAEAAAGINEVQNKMGRVLDIWLNKNDGTANVSRLLDILQILDRYDVCEDILELARDNKLLRQESDSNHNQIVVAVDGSDENIITYDDKLFGSPQRYHAYVLYAREDKAFVDELLTRMRAEGFKLCTEEELLPGHATQFEPVSRLIAERCRYIVLVYSPDFLRSPAIAFFMNLAQADAINKKQSKIVPIMYRECALPHHLTFYHNLRYPPAPAHNGYRSLYNFWERLAGSLRIADRPRINSAPETSHSKLNIVEQTTSQHIGDALEPPPPPPPPPPQHNGRKSQLALPAAPREACSLVDLRAAHAQLPPVPTFQHFDTVSMGAAGRSPDGGKKKHGALRRIINTFRGKKQKKAISMEN